MQGYVLSSCEKRDAEGKSLARREFILEFCNELQAHHKNVLNIAARAHGKTTLQEALTIQQLLLNPEATIGIFAYNRSLSKKILAVIKNELEQNARLKKLSWDPGLNAQIFWEDPMKEASAWGLNEGVVVNRRTNQIEASVEAWGLVESMPVGRHFLIRKYDDVSTHESVTTQDMIEKTATALSLSQALGKPGGWAEYYGTFYAYGDPLHSLLKSGVELRLKPCYEIETLTRGEDGSVKTLVLDFDKPVYYTKAELDDYTKHMGPVEVATQMWCLDGGAPILMADWSEKRLSEVSVGDEVMGYGPLGKLNKGGDSRVVTTVPTVVTRVMRTRGVLYRYTTESGRSVICTKDHRWFSGKWGHARGDKRYSQLATPGMNNGLRSLGSVYEPVSNFDAVESSWLGGLNRRRGFDRERIVSVEALNGGREVDVYNISTETGNYVAYGFATKNCDPRAGAETFFREDWLQYYRNSPFDEAKGKNIYILVDPAMAKDKDASYTVMWVIALGSDGNRYLVDGVRDRIGLNDKARVLFMMHRRWQPIEVRYEQYAMQADIAFIREKMEREGYRFHIRPVGGIVRKDDRIARLIPLFSEGKMFLPRELRKIREDGTPYDLVSEFLNEEYLKWPTCTTKDMLDALARIEEPDIPLIWPRPVAESSRDWKSPRPAGGRTRDAWMVT